MQPTMIDKVLRDKVREIRAMYPQHGQQTGTAYALRVARRALVDDAQRARFDSLGGQFTTVNYGARWYDPDFETEDSYGADVRVLIVPDDDGDSVLDFDCCPDPATGKPDTGARWTKCECVIRRTPEDVRDADDNARVCHYGQPCGHKCAEARRADREGVYGVSAQYRDTDGAWIRADECWGFVGEDWRESVYDTDAIDSALAGYDAMREAEAVEAMALTGAAH
jgi:hypothetical protein